MASTRPRIKGASVGGGSRGAQANARFWFQPRRCRLGHPPGGRVRAGRIAIVMASKPLKEKPSIPVRHEVSAGGLIWRRRNHGKSEILVGRPAGKSTWVLPKRLVASGEKRIYTARGEA